jgi:hypothetical protein
MRKAYAPHEPLCRLNHQTNKRHLPIFDTPYGPGKSRVARPGTRSGNELRTKHKLRGWRLQMSRQGSLSSSAYRCRSEPEKRACGRVTRIPALGCGLEP